MALFEKLEEKYIKTDGVKLHTIITGSGEPLILLHGFPDFWYGWKNIILGLKDEFKLIVPDLRGYNKSDKPKEVEDYTIEKLINDIKVLKNKLQIDKFYLAGHDWGGMIAWLFAEKYPEYVKKLIIINAPHPSLFGKKISSNKKQKKASSYIFRFQNDPEGSASFLKDNDYQGLKLAVFGSANKESFSSEDKKRYQRAWSQPGAIKSGIYYYTAFDTAYEGSRKIEMPTLVIWGMKDLFLTPKLLEGLSKYVKDLEIVKSEKSTHWVMHDDPDLVIENIRKFLKKA
ncbi:MAG: alpha/beta fold hydrolase [Candidatus Lokiarchaeota archaeon]|nr:alpha/beta fold hydrolase [Candidatus Lokiarchaeota archaeon]